MVKLKLMRNYNVDYTAEVKIKLNLYVPVSDSAYRYNVS